MRKIIRTWGLFLLLALSNFSGAEQHSGTMATRTSTGFGFQLSSDNVTVVNEAGAPIEHATILLGQEEGNPFPGNVLVTDENGLASVPSEWNTAITVTVQAPGYITTTMPDVAPGSLTIQLNPLDPKNEFEIKGIATGFPRLVTDGKVDFALVIPALTRQNLLSFDLSTVISPKVDTITIVGNQVNLPSNISLPQQTENFIFPIELNKPDYRVYLRHPGQQIITATHGQFPLQRVINDIRAGKSMFELINHFTFVQGGQKSLDVQGNLAGQDLAVNQTPFNTQVAVRAPVFPANQQMVSLALIDQNGALIPTDLKRLNSSQTLNLKSFNSSGLASLFSFLVEAATNISADHNQPFAWFRPLLNLGADGPAITPNAGVPAQDFSRLSFAFQSAAGGANPVFLPLIKKPSLSGSTMTFEVPTLPAGLVPVATYLILNEVETITTGDVTSEKRSRLWEVWSTSWMNQIELPKIPINRQPNLKYRWEVMFMARPMNFIGAAVPASRVDLSTISHVTRNSLDI